MRIHLPPLLPLLLLLLLLGGLHPAPLTACRIECGECKPYFDAATARLPQPLPQFYLHEAGGLNFSGVLRSLREINAGRPPDLVWPVGIAQHLIEGPLITSLAAHPHRTYDPANATLHVLAVAPHASWMLALLRGEPEVHVARMRRAAEELALIPHFNRNSVVGGVLGSSAPAPLYVQIVSGFDLRVMGDAFQKVLVRGNVLLGCLNSTMAL